MKKLFVCLLMCLSTLVFSLTPEEILYKSDMVRGAGEGFSVDIKINDFVGSQLKGSMEITTHIQKVIQNQEMKSIVKIHSPAVSRGQIILKAGSIMWLYSPNSRNIIRIPAQQRLLGNISNGDVSSVNYRFDYTIVNHSKNENFYYLEMERKNPQAIYPVIHYWIDKETFEPQKAEFYTNSGRLLKIMEFIKYKPAMGANRPYKVVITDGLNREKVSECYYTNYSLENLADKFFQKAFLKYVP